MRRYGKQETHPFQPVYRYSRQSSSTNTFPDALMKDFAAASDCAGFFPIGAAGTGVGSTIASGAGASMGAGVAFAIGGGVAFAIGAGVFGSAAGATVALAVGAGVFGSAGGTTGGTTGALAVGAGTLAGVGMAFGGGVTGGAMAATIASLNAGSVRWMVSPAPNNATTFEFDKDAHSLELECLI